MSRRTSFTFSISFEALLLGHEDWIYSICWNKDLLSLQLLSASADNSLVIWEPEYGSGIWICRDRLGEVSVQKGSTTATGSTGGFWIGLWANLGNAIVGLGRTGMWRGRAGSQAMAGDGRVCCGCRGRCSDCSGAAEQRWAGGATWAWS